MGIIYRHYKDARDAAWQLLIDNHIVSLPVDVPKLCTSLGIILKLVSNGSALEGRLQNRDAAALLLNDDRFIIYRPDVPSTRLRFTLAHELGHILFDHLDQHGQARYSADLEEQANIFASRLLMPLCVIKECGATDPEKIAKLCGVSLEAATYRAERLTELTTRNKFYTSPLERQVVEMFEPFIQKQKPDKV